MKGAEPIYIKIYDYIKKKIYLKPIHELIKEMVGSQMPISFEIEALKAQTIIARTLIVLKCKSFGGRGCSKYKGADFCTDGHCGEWLNVEQLKQRWKKDFEKNWDKLTRAEEETKDQILTINNKPIYPSFHCTCGGATENSERVEGGKVLYLRKVLCDYCKESPYYRDSQEFTLEEIEKKLNVKILPPTPVEGPKIEGLFEDIQRDEDGRIISIKIGGERFRGIDVMKRLGINSSRFGWQPITFRIETQGRGDGVGLCQYGADSMARKEGKKAEEILNYYFTGIQIKKIEKPSIQKPLSGKIIVVDPGHGGDSTEDTVGPRGLQEKHVNLDISLKLVDLLKNAGAQVYITRTEDVFVPLSKRADLANQVKPDFFLSIHQNFFANPSISGTEIYYHRGDEEGKALGNNILDEISKTLNTVPRGVKIADFYIFREITSSALQIEVAFLTNPNEEQKLKDEDIQYKAAEAIMKGLIRYYSYE